MVSWFDLLQWGDPSTSPPVETVMLSLLLGFLIGQVIGWVYMTTHNSPSYSSSFVASLVVLPVIVSLMMILVTGSLMIAFGLLAVFAIVRFRNVLKDTRDTTFIMWAIVEGMSVGTFRFSTALVGAVCVVLVLLYLRFTEFGVRNRFDATLSFAVPLNSPSAREEVEQILHRFADRLQLTSERLGANDQQIFNYRLLLRNPSRRAELRQALAETGDVKEMAFFVQQDEAEI